MELLIDDCFRSTLSGLIERDECSPRLNLGHEGLDFGNEDALQLPHQYLPRKIVLQEEQKRAVYYSQQMMHANKLHNVFRRL
jgi:hypothetical protein